jgi:hypothetical protein
MRRRGLGTACRTTAHRTHGRVRSASPDPRSAPAPHATYDVAARRWWLHWPCEDCGGFKLPILCGERFGDAVPGRVLTARARPDRECPGCETRRRRLETPHEEPAVWYDTLIGYWVVRLPVDSWGKAALLPLEIGWFDSTLATVYRTAADVVYRAEDLDCVTSERRRTDGGS